MKYIIQIKKERKLKHITYIEMLPAPKPDSWMTPRIVIQRNSKINLIGEKHALKSFFWELS